MLCQANITEVLNFNYVIVLYMYKYIFLIKTLFYFSTLHPSYELLEIYYYELSIVKTDYSSPTPSSSDLNHYNYYEIIWIKQGEINYAQSKQTQLQKYQMAVHMHSGQWRVGFRTLSLRSPLPNCR